MVANKHNLDLLMCPVAVALSTICNNREVAHSRMAGVTEFNCLLSIRKHILMGARPKESLINRINVGSHFLKRSNHLRADIEPSCQTKLHELPQTYAAHRIICIKYVVLKESRLLREIIVKTPSSKTV